MKNEADIKVGKTYPIKHLKEELKKHPDIRLGHIFSLNDHQYHLGLQELEALEKMMIEKERKGIIIYDMSGRNRIDATSVIVLSIMDPYTKYEKYGKFYDEFSKQIESAIDSSDSGVVMAPSVEILTEARKEGLAIEKEDDLFDGLHLFFTRKGIENRRIMKGLEGERKEFVVFGREGTITKEEKVYRKSKDGEKKKLITESEYDVHELKEKTKEFGPFYSELENTVLTFIKNSKTGDAAVKIDNIMDEARKTIPNVSNRKDIFLKGLIQFYKENGVSTEITEDDNSENFMIFKVI